MTNADQWEEPFAPDETVGEIRFAFDWYESFLRTVDEAGYQFGRYGGGGVEPGTTLLRHDVDLSPFRARKMAELETELGIHSTYFFMVASPMYNVFNATTRETIADIADMGHDVGLHFSTHQYWAADAIPDDDTVAKRVLADRDALSAVADPIETVSFHIPPDPVLRRSFERFPSTYEPRFFTDIGYIADSDQRWRSDPPRVEQFDERVQLLVHPGLWGEDDDAFEARVRQGVDEMRQRTSTYARERYVTQQFG